MKTRVVDSGRIRGEHLQATRARSSKTPAFSFYLNVVFVIVMTEMFSTMFGQNETQGPPGSSSLGFGPGKPPPPLPQNQVSLVGQLPPQLGDEGPALRKPAAMNEPFYLLRELPGTIGKALFCCKYVSYDTWRYFHLQ